MSAQEAALVPHRQAELQAQRILWVEIEAEDPMASLHQQRRDMGGERRLSDAPLGGYESDQGHEDSLPVIAARRGAARSHGAGRLGHGAVT